MHCVFGIAVSGMGCLFVGLGPGGWGGDQVLNALGEAVAGEGEFGFGFAEVAGGDRPGDVGHEFEDCGRLGAGGVRGEVAQDAEDGGGGCAGDGVVGGVPASVVVRLGVVVLVGVVATCHRRVLPSLLSGATSQPFTTPTVAFTLSEKT